MSTLTASPRPGDGQVTTVRGEAELFARAGHLFAAREEFVCAATDMSTWAAPGARHAVVTRMAAQLAAGLQVRKLYNPAAVADPGDAAHLLEIASTGVRIRICATALAHETIIVDRRTAILAGPPVAGVREYSVITAPDVVAGVRSLFLATWEGATDLADYLPAPPPVVDEQGDPAPAVRGPEGRGRRPAPRGIGADVPQARRRPDGATGRRIPVPGRRTREGTGASLVMGLRR
jgi:hypothetical protein